MAGRPSARELERGATARPPAAVARAAPSGEVLAMLRRRGLAPRVTRRSRLPFPPGLSAEALERIAARLGHYSFRLFLRGALLAGGSFAPEGAARYVKPEDARAHAEWLVGEGLARRAPGGAYALVRPAESFGEVLEWWVGRELRRRLALDVATGVRFPAAGVGGDLDVVATAEGKLLYVELKSSPPKHLTDAEVAAFLRRVRALRPDVAVFAMDTALRLGDKVLPMLSAALGPGAPAPRRLARDNWALGPHLYAVSAKQDLVLNLEQAIAEGFRALAPPPP
jgi:hypothetical protein